MNSGLCLLTLAAVLAGPGAFAADDEKAAFYRPPQLFVMTGFIANTTSGTWGSDFVGSGEWNPQKQLAALAQWNKGLGKDYDPDAELLRFKQSGATGIIFYDKWHDGLVPHDTKLTHYKTERDLVGPTLRAARKHGLKAVVYYSVGLDSNPEPKFKDWVCLDAQGRPMGRAFPTDWLSFHSPYRQYVIDHLVEILRMHGPFDAFWLDLYIQPVPSYDRYTKAAFQKRYGKPLEKGTHAEHVEFELETRREFLLDIRKAVTAIQPGIALTYNSSGRADMTQPRLIERVDKLVDYFSMEGHTWMGIDHGATGGHNADRPGEVGMLISSSWYVPMEDTAPPPAMTPDEAVASAAWAFVRGANVYGAMTPGHSGRFDQTSDVKLLGAIGAWLGKHKPWIEGAEQYADAGVVRGVNAPDLLEIPAATDFWPMTYPRASSRGASLNGDIDKALRDIGYFSDVLGTAFPRRPEDFKNYRLLVLPENAVFDDALAQKVREYVRAGGKLLAFGNASRLDPQGKRRPNFALNDVFGANLAGELPGYKRMTLLPGSGLSAPLRVNPGALQVTPTTARILAQWQSAGNAPAILENRFGQGSVLYVTADQVSCLQSKALLEELAGRLIGSPVVKVHSSRQYALLMNRRGDDLILYLFNRSTGSRAYVESGLTPQSMDLLPTEPVQISIDTRVLNGAGAIEVLPDGKAAKFSARDGELLAWVDAAGSVTSLRLTRRRP
ncbi:MAG: alpha-L-fucosidase [Bryobacterales bacterium]|nr:alpha-L-fucosidase [Bryobacterales bacterium]